MGSAFDSEVYAERQRLPGVAIDAELLMRALLWNGTATPVSDGRDQTPVSITVEYRPDVETGEWWTVKWGDQFAAATRLDLALFRAAVIARRADERAKRYAGMAGEPGGPAGGR